MTVIAIPVPPQGVSATPPIFSTTKAHALHDLRSQMARLGFRLHRVRPVARGVRLLQFVRSLGGQQFSLAVQVMA